MSNRTQLFARTPRGGNASAPKGTNSKERKPLVINKAFMAEFHKAVMSDDLEYVLKSTKTELKFSVSSNGTGSAGVYDINGKILADEKDVEKLGAINSFVSGERRSAEKDTLDTAAKKYFVAMATVSFTDSERVLVREQTIGEFKSLYKPLEGLIRVLTENVKDIGQATFPGLDGKVARYIVSINSRIRESVAAFLVLKFKGEKTSKKLNDFLFHNGVPTQVFSRLTSARVDWSKSGPQALLFPKDPSKGFALSVKEIRDPLFCDKQVGMLDGAGFAIEFFRNDLSFKLFANVPDEDFVVDRDEKVPFIEKYGNKAVLIPVPELDVGTFVEVLRKGGPSGYAWPKGRSLTPGDLITFLGAIFKQAQFAGLPNMRIQHDILKSIVPQWPGFDRSGIQRDPLIQFTSWYDKTGSTIEGLTSNLNGMTGHPDSFKEDALVVAARSLLTILGVVPEDGDRHSYIVSMFRLDEDMDLLEGKSHPDIPKGTPPVSADGWAAIVSAFKKANLEDDEVQGILTRLIDRKTREASSSSSFTARSVLGRSGIALKHKLQGRRNLSIRVEDYLRSFFSMEVQEAVGNLLLARFDGLFSQAMATTSADLAGMFDAPVDEGVYDAPAEEADEEEYPGDDIPE